MRNSILAVALLMFSSTSHGIWVSKTTTDEMTDEKIGIALTKDEDTLVVGCDERSTGVISVYIKSPFYLNSEDVFRIKYRIDKETPVSIPSIKLGDSVHFRTISNTAENTSITKNIILGMIKGHSILTHVPKYRGTLSNRFTLIGFTKAFKKACGWHPDYNDIVNGHEARKMTRAKKKLGVEEASINVAEAERQRIAEVAQAKAEAAEDRRALVRRLISLQEKYRQAIKRKIKRNWVKPPGASGEIGCDVVITQLPSGDVVEVDVRRCTGGGDLLRRSVEAAVLKSSPLPAAPDPAVFDRTVNLFFRPER